MLSCELKGKQLRDYHSLRYKPKVEAKLKVLSVKWNSLQSVSQAKHDQLEAEFQLTELLAWLEKEEERLEAMSIPGVMVDKLEGQLTELQVKLSSKWVSREHLNN